jgi:hypothetical protein
MVTLYSDATCSIKARLRISSSCTEGYCQWLGCAQAVRASLRAISPISRIHLASFLRRSAFSAWLMGARGPLRLPRGFRLASPRSSSPSNN